MKQSFFSKKNAAGQLNIWLIVSLEDALGIAQHTTYDHAKHVGFGAPEVGS